jgi:hypothetical protein
MILRRQHDDLPSFVDSNIFKDITATFIREDWCQPCHNLVNNSKKLLQQRQETIEKQSNQLR